MGAEQKLQSKIIERLESQGWIVVKTITLSKSGYPDVFAFRNKEAIFIEVKAKNGKCSELQKHRISELKREGFRAAVIYSIEEFEDFIL